MIHSYIRNFYFSNPKVRLYNDSINYFLIDAIPKWEKRLLQLSKKLKNEFSYPYHKAEIKASKINELIYYIFSNTSAIEIISREREEFLRAYGLINLCEGCKQEPIQEECHIIRKAKETRLKLWRYSNTYANLLLLCGTCHRLLDTKGKNATKKRYRLLIRNLQKRKNIQRRILKNLIKDRDYLKEHYYMLKKILGLPRNKRIKELKSILKMIK